MTYNALPLLRDPLADSNALFANNQTYERTIGGQTIVEKAFTNREQRRVYYPIFDATAPRR